jgi:hypothetical protein
MFKKKLLAAGVAAALIGAIFIPPVRAAAESALSVFRVNDTKTIEISVSDLESLRALADAAGLDAVPGELQALGDRMLGNIDQRFKPIEDTGKFTAFDFSLPESLRDETPILYAADPVTDSFVLDTSDINEKLAGLGAAERVDNRFNGTKITVAAPSVVIAEYKDVALLATQRPTTDAPDGLMDSLKTAFLSVPGLSENLRSQLAAVNPKSGDIYLPVIQGLGRPIDIGGATGYVYTAADLRQVLSMLPDFVSEDSEPAENISALVWTRDGVVYCLTGEKTDSALAQLARSIR